MTSWEKGFVFNAISQWQSCQLSAAKDCEQPEQEQAGYGNVCQAGFVSGMAIAGENQMK